MMKMKKWFFGMLFILTSLVACNKDFLFDSSQDPTLKDLSLTTLPVVDTLGAFAKPSIQQGGWVFVSPMIDKKTGLDGYKNNPENYPYLNLDKNRWGWACNLAIAPDILPPTLNYDLWLYHSRWFGGSYYQQIQNVIQITNDETNLYVTVNFNLSSTNLHVSKVTTWAPESYVTVTGLAGWNTVNTYTVPLNTIPNYTTFGTPIYVYFYGYYGTYYRDRDASTRNWIAYTPILPVKGTAEFPLYSGSGLNDINKGSLVGKVFVQYTNPTLTVKYEIDEGYEMTGVQVYANDETPTHVAPGQFDFKQSFDPAVNEYETTFEVPDVNADGKIWFILHASVVNL